MPFAEAYGEGREEPILQAGTAVTTMEEDVVERFGPSFPWLSRCLYRQKGRWLAVTSTHPYG